MSDTSNELVLEELTFDDMLFAFGLQQSWPLPIIGHRVSESGDAMMHTIQVKKLYLSLGKIHPYNEELLGHI